MISGQSKIIIMSSLTVLSRISGDYFRFWAAAVVVDCLNLELVGHISRSPRHNNLGDIGHVLRGPVLVHVLLSPLHFVLQTRPVGLKSFQRLQREHIQEKHLTRQLLSLLLTIHIL